MNVSETSLPIIDLSQLKAGSHAQVRVAQQLDSACRRFGFFYLVGHDVPTEQIDSLMSTARQFFAGPVDDKLAIHMSKGGRAWRGYFKLGEELTSGRPDGKEGIYLFRHGAR